LFGLADAAHRIGAVIREHTPVREISEQHTAVRTDEGVIQAAHVIVAVNAWVSALLPRLPLIHSALTYACATEPLTADVLRQIGLGDRMPFYTIDRPYLWGRVAPHGEVVFGAGLTYEASAQLDQSEIGNDAARAVLQGLVDRVRGLNPAMTGVRIARQWAGPIAFTESAIPLIGAYPSKASILVAAAYAGHGVALSVYAGALLARAVLHNDDLPKWGAIAD
jgi:glycine/D-amino acid oxidase-like deaminating enzyme